MKGKIGLSTDIPPYAESHLSVKAELFAETKGGRRGTLVRCHKCGAAKVTLYKIGTIRVCGKCIAEKLAAEEKEAP